VVGLGEGVFDFGEEAVKSIVFLEEIPVTFWVTGLKLLASYNPVLVFHGIKIFNAKIRRGKRGGSQRVVGGRFFLPSNYGRRGKRGREERRVFDY
jgi:hypothetical protein